MTDQCQSVYHDAYGDIRCTMYAGHTDEIHTNPTLGHGWMLPPGKTDSWSRREGSIVQPGRWYHDWKEASAPAGDPDWPTHGVRCEHCGEVRLGVYAGITEHAYGKGFWPGRCPGPQS